MQQPPPSPPPADGPDAVPGSPVDVVTPAPNTRLIELPPGADPDQPRVLLQMPVDVRSISLVVLAVLASIVVLRWAGAVFVPLLLALMLTYALAPVVEWFWRRQVPRVLTTTVLLLTIVGSIGSTAYWLSDDAAELFNDLPVAARKVRDTLRAHSQHGPGVLDTVQNAATQIEQATRSQAAPLSARGVTRVLIERPPFNIRDYLWSGTVGLMGFAGQMMVVLFLTFFALCAGDTFRRKLVKITGPSLSRKKITVQLLDEITGQIERYLLVQLLMSLVVGVATWLVYWALGIEYSAVWGVVAGLLNFVPYIGSLAVTGGSALVAFLQFGTVDMALVAGGASLAIHTISGNLVTPWLTSRASSMNPVVVFASVLAWGWLWGIWGLLLGMPIMMVIKAVCDRVEDLKPIGELMGK
ncbi:AI-2E family transporter [Xylophilus ampelinus]|uniref:Putative PurR-regulated permease PerM n=1 Tax=Xylophilus ampelinus TaxID=54067 RepID=A0A318SKK0_9BURK|nr:AI-2E family transporter [Xylophilus ampelinus]MCS4510612.1 AI-2E family transporter [Xylophilus ampelinus]PYE77761.1 putative PurR-regulated permease PerM [Xylophilus ampelinus]